MFEDFWSVAKGKLIPIKSEFIVYDEEWGISGTVDQLFYNTVANELQIWDWKTNKEIKSHNRFSKLNAPLNHLDDCNFNIYSLQLGMYKKIIEKNTNLKIGKLFLCHISEKNSKYATYRCDDMSRELDIIVEDFCKN